VSSGAVVVGQGGARHHRRAGPGLWAGLGPGRYRAGVDTESVEQQLLRHAARQTKALENINWVVMALFVIGLIAAGIWVIAAVA
jgi:hypothetical protein